MIKHIRTFALTCFRLQNYEYFPTQHFHILRYFFHNLPYTKWWERPRHPAGPQFRRFVLFAYKTNPCGISAGVITLYKFFSGCQGRRYYSDRELTLSLLPAQKSTSAHHNCSFQKRIVCSKHAMYPLDCLLVLILECQPICQIHPFLIQLQSGSAF